MTAASTQCQSSLNLIPLGANIILTGFWPLWLFSFQNPSFLVYSMCPVVISSTYFYLNLLCLRTFDRFPCAPYELLNVCNLCVK